MQLHTHKVGLQGSAAGRYTTGHSRTRFRRVPTYAWSSPHRTAKMRPSQILSSVLFLLVMHGEMTVPRSDIVGFGWVGTIALLHHKCPAFISDRMSRRDRYMVYALSTGQSFHDQALTCARELVTRQPSRPEKDTRVVYTRIVNTRRIENPRERREVERLLQQSKTTISPLSIKVTHALQSAAAEDVLYRGMHIPACRKQCTHILGGVGEPHIL